MTSWFFLEMAAKSALICSLALLLAMALRQRAAADRSMVLRVGVGLLLALPLVDLAFPVLQVEAFAAPAAPAPSAMALSDAELAQLLLLAESMPPVEPTIWDDPTPLILILWAAGALAVLARLGIGVVTLRRWTRAAEPVTDPVWLAALERAKLAAGASDNLRLLVGDRVPGPLGWGWRNPVILIDYDTHAEVDEADAILAHEVAHVARRDWPALILTRLATALFWFNPLTWLLAREAVQQAEEAADAHAARLVEPTRYAETLLSWGQIGRGIGVPANSIAPGASALSRRVRAVLDKGLRERSAGSRIAFAAVLICVGIAAPVAALEFVEAARPERPPAPAAPPAPPLAAAAVAAAHPHPPAPRTPAASRPPEEEDVVDARDAREPPRVPELRELEEIGPAMERVRVLLPRLPHISAQAMRAIDPEDLSRMISEQAGRRISADELRVALERARRSLPSPEALRVHVAQIDPRELQERIRRSMPSERVLRQHVQTAVRHSHSGLEQGAAGLEAGAARMEEQARRFRDREERERIIARERARGKDVTHEDLLEAAEGMEKGARGMREGAEQMRRSLRDRDHD